jgi:hypothetical protein
VSLEIVKLVYTCELDYVKNIIIFWMQVKILLSVSLFLIHDTLTIWLFFLILMTIFCNLVVVVTLHCQLPLIEIWNLIDISFPWCLWYHLLTFAFKVYVHHKKIDLKAFFILFFNGSTVPYCVWGGKAVKQLRHKLITKVSVLQVSL